MEAFKKLKEAMNKALILALPDFNKYFIIECDVSSCEVGAFLSKLFIGNI